MKNLLIIFTICLLHTNVFCQTKLESKKIYSGKFATEKGTYNTYEDCIKYNNELLLLNYDAGIVYKLYFTSFTATQILSSYSIDRIDPNTRKIKNIPILQDFQGLEVNYEGYLLTENMVKLFFTHYNKKEKTEYVFCSELDLLSNKSKTKKIFENKTKGEGVKKAYLNVIPNHADNTVAIVDLANKGRTVSFDYVIKDFDLEILQYAENIAANSIQDKDIKSFSICKNGEIVFNTITREKGKGLLKAATYNSTAYVLKDKKLNEINLNIAKYQGNTKLLKGINGEPMVVMNYSEVNGGYEGIYIATIDVENFELINKNKITYESLNVENYKTGERAISRKERQDKRDMANSSNITTDVQISPNGDIYILQENKRIYTRTTTSRSGAGAGGITTTTTRTYYDYGPGAVHCIAANSGELKGFVKLDYRFSSTIDMVQGIRFKASNDKKIWVEKGGEYYTYTLDNSTKKYYTGTNDVLKQTGKAYANLFASKRTRKINTIFTIDDKAYNVSKTSKNITIGEILLK